MKHGLLISLLVFVSDQLTKYLVVFALLAERPFIRVTGFLNLVSVRNTGISFSLFAGTEGMGKYLLLVAVLLIILWLCFWMYRENDRITKMVLGAIIGGALGNFIDRFTYGGVVDFIDFHVAGHHWPAFNIGDSFICVGAVVMAVRSIMVMKKEKLGNV